MIEELSDSFGQDWRRLNQNIFSSQIFFMVPGNFISVGPIYQSMNYEDLGDSVILNHQIMIFEIVNLPAEFLYPEKNAINGKQCRIK